MKLMNKYQRKTIIVGIIVGLINLVQYIFFVIPKFELKYSSLLIVIPCLALMIWIAYLFESYDAFRIFRQLKSSFVSEIAYTGKIVRFLILLFFLITVFLIRNVAHFYLIISAEAFSIGSLYSLDYVNNMNDESDSAISE